MKRIGFLVACTALLLGLAGCGGGEVDETLLPTRIPTLGPEDFAVVVAPSPTATSEPAPTEEPAVAEDEVGSETPEGEPTATEETATPEAASTAEEKATPVAKATIAYGLEVTGTVEIEETPEETPPPAESEADAEPIAASEEISGTGKVQPEASGQEITSTLELTATETGGSDVDAGGNEVMTDTISTGSALSTATPDPAANEQSEAAEPAVEESPEPETTTPEPDAETDAGDSTGDNAPIDPGLPENIAAALADADMDNGETLTLSSGCIACHSLDASQPMPGPTWANVANTAATRVEGQEAEAYLYHSIVYPNEHIAEGFQPNIMLQIYGDTLSEQDIADIIAYLLTLTSAN